MAGKKGKGAKGKKSKGGKASGGDADAGDAVDKNAVVGEACFRFRNKDHYRGGYRATRTPLSVVREGPGEYITRDGQTYTGVWANDVLLGDAETSFADGSRHVGLYENNAYHELGVYLFQDEVAVRCHFDELPQGELLLTDPRGRRWIGQAEESGATFMPVNRFLPTEDVTNRFHRKVEPSPSSSLRSSFRGSSKSASRRSQRTSLRNSPTQSLGKDTG